MKSFSQFLNESYLREVEAVQGRLLNRKNQAYKDINNPNTGNRGYATDPTPTPASRRLPAGAPEAPKASPGQLNIPEPKTTTVASPTTTPSSGPTGTPPTGGKPPIDLPPSAASSAAKESQKAAAKTVGKGIFKTLGRVAGPASAALDVADERSKGSGWARSLAKGAIVAAGGALGGAAGSAVAPGAGTLVGATGGAMAASKAFDVAAGANAKERKAMATANRQRQAGTAVKGIGGTTTFDTKKNTITTGSGAQRKTVGLAKTGVVQRGGQSVAGNLAYKGGKAVYKAGPDPSTLAKTSTNWLERVGRTVAKGAYKAHDAKVAAKKLATARASDAARNKALGVKSKPAG